MGDQRPPQIEESGRQQTVRVPKKYVGYLAAAVVLFALMFGFLRAWSVQPGGKRKVDSASLAARNPIDERTPEEVKQRLDAEARQRIQEEAMLAQQTGNGALQSLAAHFGRRGGVPPQVPVNAAGVSGYGGGYTYPVAGQHFSSGSAPVDKKAVAKQLQERQEEQAFRSSKVSSVVLSFDDKPAQKETQLVSRDEEEKVPRIARTAAKKEAPVSVPDYGPTHTMYQGTVIDTVLVNGLNAAYAGPLKTTVTTDVYSRDRSALLIKAGSEFIGEASRVSETGQERVAITFSRLLRQDGFSLNLDEIPGLSQQGETGLKDKVNHHYLRTFAMAGAVGALAGFSLMNTRYGIYDGSGYDEYRQGFAMQMGRTGTQIFNRFLNMPWDVTIRPGWRVEIFLMKDIELPAQE